MRLEDLNDLELRDLREKVSSLTLATKNLISKNDSQREQSEFTWNSVGEGGRGKVYVCYWVGEGVEVGRRCWV